MEYGEMSNGFERYMYLNGNICIIWRLFLKHLLIYNQKKIQPP